MKRLAATIAAIALIGTPVFAADMPVKAPPPPPAPAALPSWEGFYIGGDIGYGIGISDLLVDSFSPVLGHTEFGGNFYGSHGVIGGVLGGYNHMLAPRWLLGIEADASWSDIDHTEHFDFFSVATFNFGITENHAYSVRGRFGYLLTPNTLLYATGGWSWSQFGLSVTSNLGGTPGPSEGKTLNLGGPEVGFGVETQLGGGWNARLEYLEAFYDKGSFESSNSPESTINLKPAVGVGRFALIYRFGADNATAWPTPSATPSWNGPTIAATVAAVSATAKVDLATLNLAQLPQAPPDNDSDGFGGSAILPTVLLGYNWQIAPRWVFGVDGGAAPGIQTTQIHIDWTAAAHARLGFLLTPATMIYSSVGWFQSGFNGTQLFANHALVPHQRANALEIGAGVETALDEHWGVRFEYQYGFIQTINNAVDLVGLTFVPPAPTGQLTVALHPQVQSAQVGLVYRFNN